MTDTMNSQIEAVIRESLPAQVADTLRKRLSEADSFEIQIEELKQKVDSLSVENKEQQERLANQERLLARVSGIEEREAKVQAAEIRREVFELEAQLKAARMVNDRVMSFVDALMRNTEYRREVSKYMNTHWQNGEEIPYDSGSSTTEKAE